MKTLTGVFCLVVLSGCHNGEAVRAERPLFKGVELYSWKPDRAEWHFSVLAGTNRMKPVSEIMAPETAIVSVRRLKGELATLAKGEKVFWSNLGASTVPERMVKEVEDWCRHLEIELTVRG